MGFRRSVWLVFVLFLCQPPGGVGAVQDPQAGDRETVYIDGRSLLPCLVQLPAEYDPSESYPLVIGLHGHGGRADDFFMPAPLFRNAGVIYAVPQAPYAFLSAGRVGYSWNLRSVDNDAGDRGQDELTIRYVLDVLESLRERYSVGGVYLMGFSQGGAFTYRTAIPNHTRFTGLVAFGSRFDPEWFSEDELLAARNLRVFVSHGRSDPVVPRSTLARDALDDLGYEVEFYDFDGGHMIARSAIDRLLEWIKR